MRLSALLLACLAFAACGEAPAPPADVAPDPLDELARDYVVLELAMGEIDEHHVDAYSGPPELREQAIATGWTLDDIPAQAAAISRELLEFRDDNRERVDGLLERLHALAIRVSINKGEFIPFDDEAEALFGARAPEFEDGHFDEILAKIAGLLPGELALAQQVEQFRSQFDIPADKVDVVFRAALEECRRRTLEHIDLPAGESFSVEYVSDKPWSGYNWYQGNAVSLIQVNTDFPLQISRAVDLGCHEGYPGHHTFNVLLERELKAGRGWIEYSLYPLFSPQSLIAEGSGNYGIRLAFPGDERIRFEREVLFPLAGLDASEADRYYELLKLLQGLSYAGNEAARDYLNGDITREEAEAFLVAYALNSPERAAQRVRFFDTYRSYVINYNLGQDLVAEYIERDGADEDTRWTRFEDMLSRPFSAREFRRTEATP